jgi:hypothetical protein
MKTQEQQMYRSTIQFFLISALVEGEWSASCPWRNTLAERAPITRWTGKRVGPRICIENIGEVNILDLLVLERRPLGRPSRNQPLDRVLNGLQFSSLRNSDNRCPFPQFPLLNDPSCCFLRDFSQFLTSLSPAFVRSARPAILKLLY